MLKTPTTLIVGAGASCEYQMPDGRKLATQIASSLDIQYDLGRLIKGDDQIANTLGRGATNAAWQQACWRICSGLPALADSIDNYLDNHRDDTDMQRAGRVAIVKGILAAERQSTLFHAHVSDEPFDFAPIESTWLVRLFRVLQRGCRKSDVERFFENCRMVIFNYDRCVETFFVRALVTFYQIDERQAQLIVASAPFHHVYGSVGALPGFSANRADVVEFGSSAVNLLDVSARIRTYSDQTEDEALLVGIGDAIETADLIVFLGFSYNPQNLDLLSNSRAAASSRLGRVEGTEKKPRIIGSGLGVSPFNTKNIANNLKQRFSPGTHKPLELHPMTCGALIEEFSTAFDR